MTCREIEELMLDDLDAPVGAHLAGCARCREFLETQRAIDRSLAAQITAPALSAGFDRSLRRRLAAERRRALWDYLPDVLHLGGGLAGSLVCAWLLPEQAKAVLAMGAGFTVSGYLILVLMRTAIENIEDAG